MSSSKNPDGSSSPVWALLNSLKSRNPTSPTSAEVVDKILKKPAEMRRDAIDEFCADLDILYINGEKNRHRLFNKLTARGKRGKEVDNFIADCTAKRVLDHRNSKSTMESAANSARGHLAVANVALVRAQGAARNLSIALDKA